MGQIAHDNKWQLTSSSTYFQSSFSTFLHSTIPREQALLHTLVGTVHKTTAWRLQGHAWKRDKRFKKPVRIDQESNKTMSKSRAYLLSLLFTTFKFGGCIVSCLRHFWQPYGRNPQLLALQGSAMEPGQPPPVHFDLDSIPIVIDNDLSQCMANDPHLFKDLHLTSNRGQVDGIGKGLETGGEGTFKFSIKDNDRKVHRIKVPNSLYVPDLRVCLLLPQHWGQEVGNGQTWMGNFEHNCVLNWKGRRKTVPFKLTINTPIFYTAPSSCAYCMFDSIFKACEAPYFCRETVLQFPECRHAVDEPALVPEEFVAGENIKYCKDVSASEKVSTDNETAKSSNLLLPPQ
jgi:hypothetical protein